MSVRTPNGSRILAVREAAPLDVTEGVQVAYDLVLASLDFGSGFLTIEDVIPLGNLALACGFDDSSIVAYMNGAIETAEHDYGRYLKPAPARAAKAKARQQADLARRWLAEKRSSSSSSSSA